MKQSDIFSLVPYDIDNEEDLLAAIEVSTESVSKGISASDKALHAQYFTPMSIAIQMAQMIEQNDFSNIGDHGAGTGILSTTLIALKSTTQTSDIQVNAYEIDRSLHPHIQENINNLNQYRSSIGADSSKLKLGDDFTLLAEQLLQGIGHNELDAISLNPPYQKLNGSTPLAQAFKDYGFSVPNLYAAFIAMSVMMLKDGGELVAIVPRSFCNGTYFSGFRKWFLSQGSIDWFVRFKRRSNCFKRDNVLQENVIFRFTKGMDQRSGVRISLADSPEKTPLYDGVVGKDVVFPSNGMIWVPATNDEMNAIAQISKFPYSLSDFGLKVSTGKMEDFRLKLHLSEKADSNKAPVIYAHHWENGSCSIKWSDISPKPCYLDINEETEKKLVEPGSYILIKRISANDDRSTRCNPCFVTAEDINGDAWAIDNHIQYIRTDGVITDSEAKQLTKFLSQKLANDFFRVVSGTTQLNKSDLHSIRIPAISHL